MNVHWSPLVADGRGIAAMEEGHERARGLPMKRQDNPEAAATANIVILGPGESTQ
jgi:hypothetical protein